MAAALPPGPRLPRAVQTAAWITRPGPFLLRAHRQFGDVFTIRIGGEPPWVMLAHPDAVREVFTGDPAVMHAGKANLVLRPPGTRRCCCSTVPSTCASAS